MDLINDLKGRLLRRRAERARRIPVPRGLEEGVAGRVFGAQLKRVHAAPDGIVVLDASGLTVRYANPAVGDLTGYAPDALTGATVFNHLHSDDRRSLVRDLEKIRELSLAARPLEFRIRHADGSWRYVQATNLRPLDARPEELAFLIRDVTASKTAEVELRNRAFLDPLTGLANRVLFMDRLRHALVRSERQRRPVSVLFVDLDGFKFINDSFGHEAGDNVLIAVARRLRACSRPEDTVARYGGDEFTILLEDATEASDARGVAARIDEALRSPITSHGVSCRLTASVGIATSDPDRQQAEELLRAADAAMYRAKRRKNNSYRILKRTASRRTAQRAEMEHVMRRALERTEFVVHYQPGIALGSKRIAGMEALLRWNRPGRGLIGPPDFFASVENSGLILPLGNWVLEEACRQASRWQEQYPEAPPWVSVNISARQLRQPGLVGNVASVLQKTGLRPDSLVLEVSENTVMENSRHASATLRRIRASGVRIAIDDFGSALSSLSAFERLPVDLLKIDQSFIGRLGRDSEAAEQVSTLVDLSQAFGIQTVAEGVETWGQLERLRDMRCEIGQGYYFSRPLPARKASALLKRSVAP